MNGLRLSALALLLAFSSNDVFAQPPETGPATHIVGCTVTLVDDSQLRGTTPDIAWRLSSSVLGEVPIPAGGIANLERIADDGARFVATLRNSDRLTGTWITETIELKTLIGKLSIPFDRIRRIEFTHRPQPIATGPLLHHNFRGYTPEKFHGDVADLSGNERTGRFVGADLKKPGVLERSYYEHRFDPKSPLFPTNTPFSVVVKFRTSATDADEAEPAEMMLWSTHYAGSGTDGGWLQVDTVRHGGRLRFFLGPRHTELTSETIVADSQWHTAVASWDGEAMRLYVDGELEGATRSVGPIHYKHRAPMRIGHSHSNKAAHARPEKYFFRGEIGEFWFYGRALTPEECGERAQVERKQ